MVARYLFILSILTLILLVIVWQHVEFTAMEYEEMRLREELRALTNKKKQLKIEVIRLRSAGRIEELAKKMGFVYPEDSIILPEIVFKEESDKKARSWWLNLERFFSYFADSVRAEERR